VKKPRQVRRKVNLENFRIERVYSPMTDLEEIHRFATLFRVIFEEHPEKLDKVNKVEYSTK